MAVLTFTDEYTSPIAPSRIFKASILDSHNLIPKLLPQAIKSIDITQGNGGTGSIKQINFVQGGSLTHRIDELDEKTLTYNYSLIEGEGLMENIEKISYKIKFESTLEGGTVSKMTTTVYAKGDFEMKEEALKAGKERVLGMYKVVETYLIQNPDAYA